MHSKEAFRPRGRPEPGLKPLISYLNAGLKAGSSTKIEQFRRDCTHIFC